MDLGENRGSDNRSLATSRLTSVVDLSVYEIQFPTSRRNERNGFRLDLSRIEASVRGRFAVYNEQIQVVFGQNKQNLSIKSTRN